MKNFLNRGLPNIVLLLIPVLITGLVLFFQSCEKQPVEELPKNQMADEPCHHIEGGIAAMKGVSYPHYFSPVFNPLNSNEFACVRLNFDSFRHHYDLIKYNLETGEKQVLIKDFPAGIALVVWSRTGWIAFQTAVLTPKIWRIRDDGTQLKQIAFSPESKYPVFNYEGDKLMYLKHMAFGASDIRNNPELALQTNNQVIDIHGNILDSICQPDPNTYFCKEMGATSWSSSGLILYPMFGAHVERGTQGIGLFNYNTFERQVVFNEDFFGLNQIYDIQWHPHETSFYFTTGLGFYQYHLHTGTRTKLRTSCNSRLYYSFSVSSDGSKILVTRRDIVDWEDFFSGQLASQETYIVLMGSNGYGEQRIEFPN